MSETASAVLDDNRTNRLKGKVAVITGAASGIGKETALLFALNGAEGVVLADFNDVDGAKTAEAVKKLGAKAFFIKTDVSKEKDCKAVSSCNIIVRLSSMVVHFIHIVSLLGATY